MEDEFSAHQTAIRNSCPIKSMNGAVLIRTIRYFLFCFNQDRTVIMRELFSSVTQNAWIGTSSNSFSFHSLQFVLINSICFTKRASNFASLSFELLSQAFPSTMKFTSLALTALLFGSASADFNLRAAANQLLGTTTKTDSADVRVVVHGMKHEATSDDMHIIGKAIKTAYNKVYDTAGYTMDSFKAESAAAVPEFVGLNQPDCRLCPNDDDVMAVKETKLNGQMILGYVQVGWMQPDCRLCPNDDDAVAAFKSTQELKAFHSSFESEFCALLRQSDSANFAHAHGCSFSFLDMPGQPHVSLPIQGKVNKNTEAQVLFRGTLHELSDSDMTLVDQSVVLAYNEAFASVGYGLGSFHSVADIDMPTHLAQPDCRLCPNDDDVMAVVSEAKLLVARVTPITQPDCRLCPNDDDALAAAVSEEKLAFMHGAFEKAVCQKLKNSGSANFANVHDCNFRFVHNEAGSKQEMAQA